ncbi:MAG TPA: RNA polymerase sigma factor [Actinomycetota bacterium]|nr:RNA polymerase sigma factor [Actinomycetota bacterium]
MRRLNASPSGGDREPVPAELIDRCKRGDEAAWAQLVDATHGSVYTLCLRILRDPDDAAEATQDVYLKVWRNLKGFRGDAAFETWLYRVATNTAITKHRRRGRKRTHEAGMDDEMMSAIPGTASVEASAGARLDMARLDRALDELPDHYRTAVLLRDVYGLTTAEIAKETKTSETAAKVRVHRGRKRLKELMFDEEKDR